MTIGTPDGAIFETSCHLHGARAVARSVRDFLASHQLSEQALSEWELVTAEATKNSVEYRSNCRSSEDDVLRVMVNVWPDTVEVCVEDRSTDFAFPPNPEPPDDDSEGGRGLFIISQLTDSARYLKGATGNSLIVRRSRQNAGDCTNAQRGDSLEETLEMMTEELGATHESLCSIFRFSREIGESEDVSGCTTRWLHELLRMTGASWFLLRQQEQEEPGLKLMAASIPAGQIPGEAHFLSLRETAPESVETTAARTRNEVWFDNYTGRSQLDPLETIFGSPASGICCPVHVSGRLFGVLSIGYASATCPLNSRNLLVIRTFADYLATVLSHNQAQEEAVRSRLLHREFAIAAELQRSLLPRVMPQIPGFTCSAVLRPAQSVGGDFYDFLPLDDKGMLFVIADVMGKGPAAALFAIMFRSHLHTLTRYAPTPGQLLSRLNTMLYKDLDRTDMFVSAQLAWLEYETGAITVASAGHCPALMVDRQGHQLIEARCEGPPLGIDPNATFAEITVDERQTCHLVMLTDGVTDARNQAGEMLGKESIASCLLQFATHGGDAAQLQAEILGMVKNHVRNAPVADDITLVVLSRDFASGAMTAAATPNHSAP